MSNIIDDMNQYNCFYESHLNIAILKAENLSDILENIFIICLKFNFQVEDLKISSKEEIKKYLMINMPGYIKKGLEGFQKKPEELKQPRYKLLWLSKEEYALILHYRNKK